MLQKLRLARVGSANDVHVAETVFVGQLERHRRHEKILERCVLEVGMDDIAERSGVLGWKFGWFFGVIRISDTGDGAEVQVHRLADFDEEAIVDVALRPKYPEQAVEKRGRLRNCIDERDSEGRRAGELRQVTGHCLEQAIETALEIVDYFLLIGEEVTLCREETFEVYLLLQRKLGDIPFNLWKIENGLFEACKFAERSGKRSYQWLG